MLRALNKVPLSAPKKWRRSYASKKRKLKRRGLEISLCRSGQNSGAAGVQFALFVMVHPAARALLAVAMAADQDQRGDLANLTESAVAREGFGTVRHRTDLDGALRRQYL